MVAKEILVGKPINAECDELLSTDEGKRSRMTLILSALEWPIVGITFRVGTWRRIGQIVWR